MLQPIVMNFAEGSPRNNNAINSMKEQASPETKGNWWERKPIPNCLAVSSKKVAIGWKFKGVVTIYDLNLSNPDKVNVSLTKIFTVGEHFYEIISIEFNSSREYLAIAARRPLQPKNMKEREMQQRSSNIEEEPMVIECFLVNVSEIEAMQANSMLPIRQLIDKGNTYGLINDISVSTLRNCIATAGSDRFIRIWDFAAGKFKQSVATMYETDLNDISLHPFGIQLAIAANEGIRVFYVLEEEVRLAVEISGRQCMAVQYSSGGQWLAAGFAVQIYIIDPNTFETKYVLGPHRSNITRLSWTPNDYYLVSSCKGGNTFVWTSHFDVYSTEVGAPSKQVQNKKYDVLRQNVQIMGSAYDDDYDLLVMIRADRIMEVLTGDTQHVQYRFADNIIPTCLQLCKESQVLLIGTNIGYILSFLWPLPPKGPSENYLEPHEFKVHSAEVTGIKMSIDGKYVFSGAKDGTVAIMKVTELWEGGEGGITSTSLAVERRKRLKRDLGTAGIKLKCHEPMDSLSLTFKNANRDKLARIEKLKDEKKSVEEMGAVKEQSIRKELEKDINIIKKANVKALDEERALYRKLQEQYELDCKKAESEKMRTLEDHHKELEDMNESHQKQQRTAFDLNNEKIALLEKQKSEFRVEIETIQKTLKEQIAKIEATYQSKYDGLKEQHNELLKKMKIDGIKFEEALEQSEQEYEKEIENIKNALSRDVKVVKDNNDDLKKTIEIAEKELKDTKKIKAENQEQSKNLEERAGELLTKKLELEAKVNSVEEQLKQKELIIHEKEKEIQQLRNSNAHLENFRFVLDHKILSLKEEKVPMDKQIKNLDGQVHEMYRELEKEAETNKMNNEERENAKKKLENAKQLIKEQAEEVHVAKRRLELVQYDITKIIKEPVDKWPPKLVNVYNVYFATNNAPKIEMPQSFAINKGSCLQVNIEEPKGKQLEESTRAREDLVNHKVWLENKLKSVKCEHDKRDAERAQRIRKLQRQNTDLINDANILRRDYDGLKCKVKQLEEKFKELTGISLTNVHDIDKEIKKFIHPNFSKIANKSANDGGFGQQKSLSLQHNASSILEYYNSMAKKGEEEKSGNISSLIGDLQNNKRVIEQQNLEMAKLQVRYIKFNKNLGKSWSISCKSRKTWTRNYITSN